MKGGAGGCRAHSSRKHSRSITATKAWRWTPTTPAELVQAKGDTVNRDPSERDAAIWGRLVESYLAFAEATRQFQAPTVDRVAVMRRALLGSDKYAAYYMLDRLTTSELMELFDELIYRASYAHGSIQTVRSAIQALPREWVLERIEAAAEPYLQGGPDHETGTEDEYRRFLELYMQLDRNLALKLARRAAEHSDPLIREAGEETLDELGVARE